MTTETKLLLVAFVGATLTSCLLALAGEPTFPAALLSGAVGTFALLPPKAGRAPRHYVLLVGLGVLCVAATLVWRGQGW